MTKLAAAPSSTPRVFDTAVESDPLWFKDAVIYQLHVRAFFDSSDDGIGDFAGLTQKLDYLQDLGVTAIWLLPFYPSPLRDDGYDIADYSDVNPMYGTLKDFKTFLAEAHARSLKVVTELVLNHTSDQHPWFQRARRAKPGSPERDFYVWSEKPDKYLDARIIFKDFEPSNWSWDPVAGAYFWHRFYAHQPDLNFENPAVREALFKVLDYWLEMGVDGLRLDAVPYLYEREDTNCENLPETHAFLKELRARIDAKFSNRMLLAEANQWPEDAVQYFGDGDECHAAFHFPVMPRLYMALHMEDRFPIVDILQQTPAIPENCQWFVFLRNHDELTLEMVTDEERDVMYRVYARDRQARINLGIRRRLAPLLGNDRRRIELLNGLLFSLPGTPVIYYGDEIGMGDNIYLGDRNGVRTPMQWSSDRNAGFSRANAQRMFLPVIIDSEYLYETVNVETQRANPQALWWWMKRLIGLRQNYTAFSRGSIDVLSSDNSKVLAFTRCHQNQCLLVVANLSRYVQYVDLDLSAYEGRRPIELFGLSSFPAIGKSPYLLTLSPHAFYWFELQPVEKTTAADIAQVELPKISLHSRANEVFRGRGRLQLQTALARLLPTRRWYGGKARVMQSVNLLEAMPLGINDEVREHLLLFSVDYVEGEPEMYVIPLGFAQGEESERMLVDHAEACIARAALKEDGVSGVFYDATADASFLQNALRAMAESRTLVGASGSLNATGSEPLREIYEQTGGSLSAQASKGEQSNSSVIYGDKLIFKIFRKVEGGLNPDLEIGRFLMNRTEYTHSPRVMGSLEYQPAHGEPLTLGVLHELVPNAKTAWQHSLDALDRFLEQYSALPRETPSPLPDPGERSLLELAAEPLPDIVGQALGDFDDSAKLLGARTAKMHLALASDDEHQAFAPESFSQLYQRSLYQTMRKHAIEKMRLLRSRIKTLSPAAQAMGQEVLAREATILDQCRAVMGHKLSGLRTRCHGDYHLGQVLFAANDFLIIDFEGEPARSFAERRAKQSPLRDVAGMLRSFHYAASQAMSKLGQTGAATAESEGRLRHAADGWYRWVSVAFLQGYLEQARQGSFLPTRSADIELLLRLFLLEKAVYELAYELNNRPAWVEVPLRGILDLTEPA